MSLVQGMYVPKSMFTFEMALRRINILTVPSFFTTYTVNSAFASWFIKRTFEDV